MTHIYIYMCVFLFIHVCMFNIYVIQLRACCDSEGFWAWICRVQGTTGGTLRDSKVDCRYRVEMFMMALMAILLESWKMQKKSIWIISIFQVFWGDAGGVITRNKHMICYVICVFGYLHTFGNIHICTYVLLCIGLVECCGMHWGATQNKHRFIKRIPCIAN